MGLKHHKIAHIKKTPASSPPQPEQDRFAQDVIVRGEAVKKSGDKLPPGATHEIVESHGKEIVVRRRFSVA